EITVKALTLILRSRLRNGDQVFHVAREAASHSNPAVNWPTLRPASVAADDDSPQVDVQPPALAKGQDSSAAMLPPEIFAPNDGKGPQQLSEKFLAFMPAYVAEVKQHVTALGEMDESAKRKEMAIRLHLRLQCLSRKIDVPTLRPAFELCRSLEGLLKKFVENPKNITETSVRTVSSALDLLKDLCIPGVRPDLVDKPQVRLLVVDDEPLARRALTGALQMAFTKPLTAETGEEALELAADHEFDIVFMDVCMPGMDGFAACSKIHETSRNNFTPVIFVTTLSDDEFRVRASQCGGADYVVKPFIFMEINLKALTIALRGRLEIDKLAQAPKTPVAA
ncbi:MAG TPA: response regulator, partial [Verrucomicrobiae bacterium]|nr:response regulator [Verrucomicrobiae bacterium]